MQSTIVMVLVNLSTLVWWSNIDDQIYLYPSLFLQNSTHDSSYLSNNSLIRM